MGVADLPTPEQARGLRPLKQKWEMPDRLAEQMADARELARLDAEWAGKVKARDRYRCQICSCKVQKTIAFTAARAEADHFYPKSTYPELRHEVDNGVTECLRCHRKAQQDRSLIPDWIRARAELCYRRVVLGEANPERPLL
jgi:predicted restriction endonuclease